MTNVSCDQFKEWRDAKKSYTVIDVREAYEWEEGHFSEAIHAPLSAWPAILNTLSLHKTQVIVVCCASGGRSQKASAYLDSLGYTQVYNLLNGVQGYCTFYPNSL